MNNYTDTISLKEALSAFADGEPDNRDEARRWQMSDDQLIDHVSQDADARSAWGTMHLVRDVMQGDYHSALTPDFSLRISQCIAQEETTFADEAVTADPVVSMAQARDRIASRRSAPQRRGNRAVALQESKQPFALWKPVAGLGLAASLAGATFLFSQLWLTEQPASPQLADAQQTAVALEQNQKLTALTSGEQSGQPAVQQSVNDTEALILQTAARIENGGTRWRMAQEVKRNEAIEKRLNMLLTNHLEDASMGNVNGLISHSKVVGYDSMPEGQSEEQTK